LPFDLLFAGDELTAATSDTAWVAAMCAVERALARSCAEAGVIPAEAATKIEDACAPERYDPAQIMRDGRAVANPAQPFVELLRAEAGDARNWVHFGATSQDVVDSASMLIARSVRGSILGELDAVAATCRRLAEEHRGTPMAARTLLQQAVPTTFGLKAANWLVAVVEARRQLAGVELAAQLGGAAGTLAGYGDKGVEVLHRFAANLGLAEPVLPWHTNRLRISALASALEGAAGACAKIALDVILLAQTEVAEVHPPAGGSSAMAHKQNPALAVVAVAAARQVAPQVSLVHEHERAAGAWQAEWAPLSRALAYTGGAASATRETLDGLVVDAERMRANIDPALAAYPEPDVALIDRALDLTRDV
jgi:3-carboxy-cis,cis-muconate cycloisomerase